MAKFIKFNAVNSAAAQPLGPISPVLINVDKILSVRATGATGANAKTVIVQLDNGGIATGVTAPTTLTLTVSTSKSAAVNPTLVTGQQNSLVQSVVSAITANPGGVVATASLGVDGAATPVQMYWRTAVLG